MGKAYSYKRDQQKHPYEFRYFVKHGYIDGTWGQKSKAKRFERCYMHDGEQRDTILKKLGRYIPEKKTHSRQKRVPRVECIQCHKPAVAYTNITT